jgi:hypothetical protein
MPADRADHAVTSPFMCPSMPQHVPGCCVPGCPRVGGGRGGGGVLLQLSLRLQGRISGAPGLTAPAVTSEDGREQARGKNGEDDPP